MESSKSMVSNRSLIVHSAVVSGMCLLAAVCGLASGVATRRTASSSECKDPFPLTEAQAALIIPRAASGDVQAQCLLGFAYHRGSSFNQDDGEAAKWLLKAADAGVPLAQAELGYFYESGAGVQQSDFEAVKWYRKSAQQGVDKAENNLGNMYFAGRGGMPRSSEEAATWFRKAAEQGLAAAQTNLGMLYRLGEGVARDYSEALRGIAKLLPKAMAAPTLNSESCICTGKASLRIMSQPSLSFRRAQTVAIPPRNLVWVTCTSKVSALNETMRRALDGPVRRQKEGLQLPNKTSAICTRVGWAPFVTTKKLSIGTLRQRLRV